MQFNPQVTYAATQDKLQLQGMHYAPIENGSTCVLFIHGMASTFIGSPFADELGKNIAEHNLGFIYAHNRVSIPRFIQQLVW